MLLLLVLCGSSGGVMAAAAGLKLNLQLANTRESLTNDRGDWYEQSVAVGVDRDRRQIAYVSVRETERFGLKDREAGIGAMFEAAAGATFAVDATSSETHRVLARDSVGMQLSKSLGEGWVIGGGVKRSRYPASNSVLSNFSVEQYIGSWRFAYTAYLARATGTAYSSSHRLGANYYFGDDLSAGFYAARGTELENMAGQGLRAMAVVNASANATWRITPDLSLSLDAERQKQGSFYTRRGIRIGARIGF